ncbi:MAG: hypothetical protein ACR2MX_17695 [Cyclobacteriaceae bacterium]
MSKIYLVLFYLLIGMSVTAQQKKGKKGEPMTEIGLGLQMTDIHAVILRATTTGTTYGVTLKVLPYLVLKDGTIYSRLDISPHDFDLDASRRLMPKRWGTWTKSGTQYQVQFSGGKPQQWENWYATKPAAEGETIAGIFKCVGGISSSNVHKFNTLILKKDGTFTWRYFYKSNKKFIPHSTDREIKGTYHLNSYTIEFKYHSGEIERFMFAKFKDEAGFTIGVKSFAEFEHPLLN